MGILTVWNLLETPIAPCAWSAHAGWWVLKKEVLMTEHTQIISLDPITNTIPVTTSGVLYVAFVFYGPGYEADNLQGVVIYG